MELDFLKQKEFGLPIWAWAVITALVLFLAYRFFSSRSGGNGSSSLSDQFPGAAGASQNGSGAGGLTISPTPDESYSTGTSGPFDEEAFGEGLFNRFTNWFASNFVANQLTPSDTSMTVFGPTNSGIAANGSIIPGSPVDQILGGIVQPPTQAELDAQYASLPALTAKSAPRKPPLKSQAKPTIYVNSPGQTKQSLVSLTNSTARQVASRSLSFIPTSVPLANQNVNIPTTALESNRVVVKTGKAVAV